MNDLAALAVGQLGKAGSGDAFVLGLSLHHGLPLAVQRLDDANSEGRVLGLAVECELVLGFAVGDLVDFEPLDGGRQES